MLQVTEETDVGARIAKWIYVLLAYAALAFSVIWALADPEMLPRPAVTFALVGVSAVWLFAVARWWPTWSDRRVWAVVGWLGILALNCGLIWSSQAFNSYVWIGYPFAFAIFPARWAVFAVTANSIGTLAVQGISGSSPYTVVLAVVLPVVVAGWYAGMESERRSRAIAALTETNKRLATAMEENAGLHAQLLVQAREAGVLDERQRMARRSTTRSRRSWRR
ncbi:hypothetical protein GCM10029964_013520 [Kibdelosporangium lantanae]